MENRKLSRSHGLAAKLIFTAFNILKENGGQLSGRELIEKIRDNLTLDDWAKSTYEKSGNIRWQSILQFFSIDNVKAGFLIKKKGVWYLTPEGEKAINLGEIGLFNAGREAYIKWKRENKGENEIQDDEQLAENKEQAVTIDQIEQIAIEGLEQYIGSVNPYEFQELSAALLRGMGYYTPFVSPRGKDGGVDIIAYRDPLGTISPRIKVQVKHRESPTSVHEIRQLMGLLQKDGDVGIFISTGGFTPDARSTAQGSHVHVELIDLTRFLDLWQEFYHKLTDEDKSRLPLLPVYFLAPSLV